MWLIEVVTLVALLVIFVQDIKERSVSWVLFPMLAALFTFLQWRRHKPAEEIEIAVLINGSFLLFQFLVVTVYFSIKNKRLVNVTEGLLGWGDILFLSSIAFYLSALNFLFFYIVSLIVVLAGWFVWRFVSKINNNHVPLAGLQALLLSIFLTGSWLFKFFDVTNDDWLLHLINK